jgi:hypothetical protein
LVRRERQTVELSLIERLPRPRRTAEERLRRRVHQQHTAGDIDDRDPFVQALEQGVEVRHLTRCLLELLRRPQAGQEQALVCLTQLIAGGTLARQHQLGGVVDADEQSLRVALRAEQGGDAVGARRQPALRSDLR